MIKYDGSYIVFEEIPDKVSLAINITNCQNNCIGCHSPELRQNTGKVLTIEELERLIKENRGINCVVFMGEGNDRITLLDLALYVKIYHKELSVAIYSGRKEVENDFYTIFDYVKVGPYIKEYGPLNTETTNQRLYKVVDGERIDITQLFWRKKS